MLKSMEEKGLIYKKPDPIDKRSVRIFLTPEGKRKKEISVQTIMEFYEQVREVVSSEELETFFTVFQKINHVIDNLQTETINPNEYNSQLYEI
jgi:DNA-binding MarR family transcriptional regulator